MALTVAVSEVPNKWMVRATASGATGTVTWTRDAGGRITEIGTGPDIVDAAPPLNTPLYYIATDNVAVTVSAEITVSSEYTILASAMYGTTYQVVVVSQQPNNWRARSVWHPVLDRSNGPVVSIFEAEWREGTITLGLRSRDERHDLIDMLMKGDPLSIRSPCPDRVDDLTILPLEWSDPYIVEGNYSSRQQLVIRYQSVTGEPPAYVPPPAWTYNDVLAKHASYTEVLNTYATYTDLLAAVPK